MLSAHVLILLPLLFLESQFFLTAPFDDVLQVVPQVFFAALFGQLHLMFALAETVALLV